MNTAASIRKHEENIVKCELTELILKKELKEELSVLELEKKQVEMNFEPEVDKKRCSLGLLRRELLSQRRQQREDHILNLQASQVSVIPHIETLMLDSSLSNHAVDEDIRSILRETEDREVKKYLARFKIKDCSCIGVDDSLKTILANLRILSADQIDEIALRHTGRLKPAQLTGLLAWRNYLLAQARVRSPKRLTRIQRKRIVDRWNVLRAEVQDKINSLESSFLQQNQRLLSISYDVKRSTILARLTEIRAVRHEVIHAVENYKSKLAVVSGKQTDLQNDFEHRFQRIAALIEQERSSIASLTSPKRRLPRASVSCVPLELLLLKSLTTSIRDFCRKFSS